MEKHVLKMTLKELNTITNKIFKIKAGWQSGYAAACKAVYSGSIPDSASINYLYVKNLYRGLICVM